LIHLLHSLDAAFGLIAADDDPQKRQGRVEMQAADINFARFASIPSWCRAAPLLHGVHSFITS
jgi:hypothetical protein